jgi:hypothetical protein
VVYITFYGYAGNIGRARFDHFNKALRVFGMPEIPVARIVQGLVSDSGDPVFRYIGMEEIAPGTNENEVNGPQIGIQVLAVKAEGLLCIAPAPNIAI